MIPAEFPSFTRNSMTAHWRNYMSVTPISRSVWRERKRWAWADLHSCWRGRMPLVILKRSLRYSSPILCNLSVLITFDKISVLCVCVCVCVEHLCIYIYIYIYAFIFVHNGRFFFQEYCSNCTCSVHNNITQMHSYNQSNAPCGC
jgi:hypothetical protein